MKKPFFSLVLILASLMMGCVTDRSLWEDAKRSRSENMLNSYIVIYPNGAHINEARELYENVIWDNARFMRSEQHFLKYLSVYPNGKHANEAREWLDEFSWQKLTKKHDAAGYKAYLAAYPQGKHWQEANEILDYGHALAANDITAYLSFLEKYPNTIYRKTISDSLMELEWKEAVSIGTAEAYKKFIGRNQSSKHIWEAKNKFVDLEWEKASALDTVEGYESFIERVKKVYDDSSRFSRDIEQRAREKIFLKNWQMTYAKDTVQGYEEYIMEHPRSEFVGVARDRLKVLYRMSAKEINAAVAAQNSRNAKALQSDIVSRMIMAGANYIDDNAGWTDYNEGRKIYDYLKRADMGKVIESMQRVIVVHINRMHVLFLAVKLGLRGSEEALNSLLLTYGDVSMAEDYLNSGSSILNEGGRKWAKANGYMIGVGMGSHRVSWGSF
jgi:hypothetical protein